ncbi:MAG: hypothetical protein Q8930_17235, partial [Bacillota bacterium]|nr:hypothetical protein [Bacillota bacterium]
VGVCMCVLSPIPLFIGAMLDETGSGSVYGLCILLLIVAAAVFIFIRYGTREEAYKKLLKLGEYSPVQKKSDKVVGAVASVVWPVAVCIYLLWSFLSGRWGLTWIVFPITGLLFGAFASFYSSMKQESK